jgi:serine/threonine-protein kinase HipA
MGGSFAPVWVAGFTWNGWQASAVYAKQVHTIIREVAEVTRTWQAVAAEVGAKRAEIARMASAFEHEDLQAALKL